MMNDANNRWCPYRGLQPYTEADRAFFFGRERDRELIIANLYASPLTVLYGASGVGKSSVLLAGVVPALRETPRLAIVVFRAWPNANFRSALKEALAEEIARVAGREPELDPQLPFDEFLTACARSVRGQIFFIFDQFEEYFLYHSPSPGEAGFDAEFARAVNRQDVPANFLLAMREDGLSRLDRFGGRIPRLLGNLLRLEHLDRRAAEEAVRRPLVEYNHRLPAGAPPVVIEDGLVRILLEEVKTGRVNLDRTVPGRTPVPGAPVEARIETPLLQLVLTRLWDEELSAGSRALRLETLNRLGGTENIARTHLDKQMQGLGEAERELAARLFHFLVTPDGTKIAQDLGSLCAWAEVSPREAQGVLDRLSAEMRITRKVTAAGQPDRYEIFHDALGPAILDWRRRYVEQQEQERIRREEREGRERERIEAERQRQLEQAQSLRRTVAVLAFGMLLLAGLFGFAVYQWNAARRAQRMAEDARQRAESAREQYQASAAQNEALRTTFEARFGEGRVPPPPATVVPDTRPRVYIHLRDEALRPMAEEIQRDLLASNFSVIGIQKVTDVPNRTQLRYYRQSEREAAERALKVVVTTVRGAQLFYVSGFENSTVIKPGLLEVWLAPPNGPGSRPTGQ